MSDDIRWFHRHARRTAALVAVVGLYGATRLPSVSARERDEIARRFHFTQTPLPAPAQHPQKTVRAVHPTLQRISAWISSVGASVALSDLDGDGLPNDLCHVDPRTDTVLVAPAPGTGSRYEPVVLHPSGLRYDPSTMAPMGCLPGDVNEDGTMDLIVYYWGRAPVAFLRRGAGYLPSEIAPGEERWFTNAATLADLDGDGHLDLVVANYFPDGARILDALDTRGGTESMQASMSRAANSGKKHLFLWKGASPAPEPAVRFEEVHALLEELEYGWTLAVGAQDLDGDQLPELYFASDFGPDRLLYNRSTPGHLRFTKLEGERSIGTPSSKVLGRDSFKGMGVDFGDLNDDGIPDIVVSNIADRYALLESHFAFVSTGDLGAMKRGVAPYVDRSEPLGLSRSGWGWDVKLADLDNDGQLEELQATGFVRGDVDRWPELQELATSNDDLLSDVRIWPRFQPGDELSGPRALPFFVRRGDRFFDVAREVGVAEPQIARGIALGDVDGDGDLDYAVANQWQTSFFHRNDCPGCGAFLGLHVRLPLAPGATESRPGHPRAGDPPSRPAVGAAVTVTRADGKRLIGQADGGNGHSGRRSPDLHFGLGVADPSRPLRVEIAYRDPKGAVRREALMLSPGWHTVLLGYPVSGSAPR